MGAWTTALPGTSPISVLAFGAVADEAGARAAYFCAGLLMLAVVAVSRHALTGRDEGGPANDDPGRDAAQTGAASSSA